MQIHLNDPRCPDQYALLRLGLISRTYGRTHHRFLGVGGNTYLFASHCRDPFFYKDGLHSAEVPWIAHVTFAVLSRSRWLFNVTPFSFSLGKAFNTSQVN